MKRIKLSRNTESDYGIRNYLNPYKGIQGILKHLYSDFIVEEVSVETESVKDLEIKEYTREEAVSEIIKLFPEKESISQLLLEGIYRNDLVSDKVLDKTKRTEIHKITKKYFKGVETSTKDDSIVFTKSKKNSRVNWKEKGGEYLTFNLKKENRDTLEAIDVICSRIRRPNKTFSFAGTKDKRAVTIQRVSGFRVREEELKNAMVGVQGIQVSDFKYASKKIELGDLNGNRFSIILRNVLDFVQPSVEFSKGNGFINYYGMQRFGTHSIPTFAPGILLLKGEWEKAVDLILKDKEEDNEKIREARKVWIEEKDAKKASKMFPRRCVAERAILGYFAKSNRTTDLLGAILSIPRNLRLLYVHSYQSLVWNEMASERIRIYGNTLQLGDLVDISAYTDNESLKTESESKNSRQEHIIIITKDEELKKYSIDDLVLPLPGYDVLYPQNKMMEAYKTFMEVHGFDPHDMKRKQKDFSLPGSYRKVLVRPKDYEFKLVRYDDPDQEINITEEPNLRDGKYLALILQFTLPTSSYATMCLREVLKSDTSSVYHQELSRATKLDANTDPVSDSAIVDDSLSDNNETVDAQR